MKILIADDESSIREVVALYLKKEGFTVLTAVSYTHLDVYKRQTIGSR